MAQPSSTDFLALPIVGTDLVALFRKGDISRPLYVSWAKFLAILQSEISGGSSYITSIANTPSINLSVVSGTLSAVLTNVVTAGTYGDATNVPQFTVDSQGRITGVTLVPITAGAGTVTYVGLSGSEFTFTGSPITTSGTIGISLAASGVSAGSYGSSTQVPVITVNNKGIITSITTAAISGGSGTVTSVALTLPTPTNPAFSVTGSPITSSGTFAITANGTTSEYVRGDGSLATFPAIPSGTVTSVGLSMPAAFSVSGSPVTSSGTLAVSGAGTASQVILGDGSLGTINSYFKAAYTASGAATLDIPIPSGYNKIEITVSGIYTSVINTELWIRIGTGSPVVYASGASNYSHYRIAGQTGGAPTGAGSGSDTKIVYLGAASINVSSRTTNGTIYINEPDDTSMLKQVQFKVAGWLSGLQLFSGDGSGSYILNNDAITGVRLMASSGNISGKAVIRAWP